MQVRGMTYVLYNGTLEDADRALEAARVSSTAAQTIIAVTIELVEVLKIKESKFYRGRENGLSD